MIMIRSIVLIMSILWASCALAQTPCPTQTTPNFTAGGNVFGRTAPQWNAYFGAKLDSNGGTACDLQFLGIVNLSNTTVVLPSVAGATTTTLDVLGNAGSVPAGPSDTRLVWGNGLSQICASGTPPMCTITASTGRVATNAALRALSSTAFPRVFRGGYTTDGDGGAMWYVSSGSACSLNSGNGDNGAQVASADGKCWLADFTNQTADVRVWGAQCTGADATAAIQSAVNWFGNNTKGGVAVVTCPLTVSTGNILISAGGKLLGVSSGTGYAGYSNTPGPTVWPPTTGSAINCTSTVNPCFIVGGSGVEIGGMLLGNTEPVPPSSGLTYTPIAYPYVINTTCAANWYGLYIHDITFTSTYQGIDLEGCPNYTTANSGGGIIVERITFNSVLNVGIRAHLIDYVPARFRSIEGWGMWYYNIASLGAYQRANLKFLDIEYCAACMLSEIEIPPAKYGIYLDNGVVNNNFGDVVLSFVGTMNQINFQNSCQAIYSPNTSLIAWINISNSFMWGDQSGFQCSSNLPMIDLPSNSVYLGINNLAVAVIDTLLSLGCGTPGVGSCPSGAAGGQAYGRLSDLFVNTYGNITATAPLIKIPNTTLLSMQGTDPLQLIPFAGHTGAPLFGPGLDGTQGCQRPFQLGGGINPTYGAVAVFDSCITAAPLTTSGGIAFYRPDNLQLGFLGFSPSSHMELETNTGVELDFKPNGGTVNAMSINSAGSTPLINMSSIPTSAHSGVGFAYVCIDNAGTLYQKSSCP